MPGMTYGEVQDYIRRQLGFYDKKQADLEAEIKAAQRSMEGGIKLPPPRIGSFRPWFLVSEMQTALTVINDERVPLPDAYPGVHDGFQSEYEDAALWIYDPAADTESQWVELRKFEYDYIKANYPGTGKPSAYAVVGTYFRLGKVPDAEYQLKIISFNSDLVVTNPSDQNKWMKYAPLLLAAKAGKSMASALRDASARAIFNEMLVEETLNLFIATESRMHDNKRIIMGGDD